MVTALTPHHPRWLCLGTSELIRSQCPGSPDQLTQARPSFLSPGATWGRGGPTQGLCRVGGECARLPAPRPGHEDNWGRGQPVPQPVERAGQLRRAPAGSLWPRARPGEAGEADRGSRPGPRSPGSGTHRRVCRQGGVPVLAGGGAEGLEGPAVLPVLLDDSLDDLRSDHRDRPSAVLEGEQARRCPRERG